MTTEELYDQLVALVGPPTGRVDRDRTRSSSIYPPCKTLYSFWTRVRVPEGVPRRTRRPRRWWRWSPLREPGPCSILLELPWMSVFQHSHPSAPPAISLHYRRGQPLNEASFSPLFVFPDDPRLFPKFLRLHSLEEALSPPTGGGYSPFVAELDVVLALVRVLAHAPGEALPTLTLTPHEDV